MASLSQEAVESALAAAPPMPKWIPKGPPTAAADSADQATSTVAPAADQTPSSVDPAADQAHAVAAGDRSSCYAGG
ncbi:Os12g0286100 [Oryza sativa Japonica Group]|uniref:Os12g0286100 protein n=1 Tax=Oryza sativa subsp. japonica TaxID=39947 RepID=A0A0P0Y954_ORYSJ|nr:Os12g0286100 [Oryza sativa Japonica Group]